MLLPRSTIQHRISMAEARSFFPFVYLRASSEWRIRQRGELSIKRWMGKITDNKTTSGYPSRIRNSVWVPSSPVFGRLQSTPDVKNNSMPHKSKMKKDGGKWMERPTRSREERRLAHCFFWFRHEYLWSRETHSEFAYAKEFPSLS